MGVPAILGFDDDALVEVDIFESLLSGQPNDAVDILHAGVIDLLLLLFQLAVVG